MIRTDGERLARRRPAPVRRDPPARRPLVRRGGRGVHRRGPDPGLTARRRHVRVAARPPCVELGLPGGRARTPRRPGRRRRRRRCRPRRATASPAQRRVLEEDDAALGDVEALAVHGEAGRAVEHEVDLLVAGGLALARQLVVRLDDEVAGARRDVRVRPERLDAELVAHGLPVRDAPTSSGKRMVSMSSRCRVR